MLTPRFRVWRCNSPMSAGPLYSVPTFTHPTLARRTPCLKSSHLVDLVGGSGQPAAVAGRGTNGIGWHPAQAAQEEPQADLQACTQRLQCVVVRVPSVVPAAPTTTSSARLQLNDKFLQPLLGPCQVGHIQVKGGSSSRPASLSGSRVLRSKQTFSCNRAWGKERVDSVDSAGSVKTRLYSTCQRSSVGDRVAIVATSRKGGVRRLQACSFLPRTLS